MSSPAAVLGNHVPVTTCTELQGLCQPAFLHGILQQKSAFPPTRKRPEVTLSAPWPSWALHHILFIIIRVCIPTQTWACRDPTVLHAGAPADTAGLQPACLLEAPLTLSTREIKLAAAFFFPLVFLLLLFHHGSCFKPCQPNWVPFRCPSLHSLVPFSLCFRCCSTHGCFPYSPPPLLFFLFPHFLLKLIFPFFHPSPLKAGFGAKQRLRSLCHRALIYCCPPACCWEGGVPLSPHCSNAHLWYDCASLCVCG